MPNKSTINFSTILKRSTCLNSTTQLNESVHVNELFDRVISAIQNGREFAINSNVNSFIESISNRESAAKYYWQPLKILSEMNKNELVNNAGLLERQYVTRVLPYIEDLDDVQGDLDRFTLTESQNDCINDYINKFKIADRILGNYNSLSRRFNLEDVSIKYQARGLKPFVESIANMVDTYNTKNYQKMNIVLEEVDYILSKEGIKYDKAEMVESVAEYYLSQSPYLTDKDLENYRRTLKESYVLNESDLDSVNYVFEGVNNINSINSGIVSFLLAKNKTPELLQNTLQSCVENTSVEDICYHWEDAAEFLWNLEKKSIFESFDDLNSFALIPVQFIVESINNGENKFLKNDLSLIITNFENIQSEIMIESNADPEYAKAAKKFIKTFESARQELAETRKMIYDKSNLNAVDFLAQETNTILPLKEFKIFKFHNLIRAAFNLDKFLKVKEKRIIDNGKNKVSKFMKKAKNVLFGEAANEQEMLKYIGEDGKALLTVRQYVFEEFDDGLDNEFIDFLAEVCKDYNDILISQNETCRAYYVINPGIAEIKIGEQAKADVSDVNVYQSLDESIDTYLEILGESTIDEQNLDTFKDIYENIEMMKESPSFSMEQFELALEAMSIIGTEKSKVELFANEFVDFNFDNAIVNQKINESYGDLSKLEAKVKSLVESWEPMEEVSLADKIEAYQYLQSIFEYSFPDSSDDDDDEDEDEEEEKTSKPEVKKPKVGGAVDKKDEKKETPKSVDDVKIPESSKSNGTKAQKILTNIKLGLNGLKTKIKDLDTKQKEACKNLDNAARAFATATKNALVSDNREAIIKGQVIPSFSRCIKGAIILAVVGHFYLPAAVIGAIGALALSHKLTKTERLLLLDEIETELEVVDKELQIADSNNQINKYRELLKIKKNLQRQYQRIKYNVRVGKDILPGSAVGVPNSAD